MFLGISRTDSNCHSDICPGNISGISQLLLTRFWWNSTGRFLGPSRFQLSQWHLSRQHLSRQHLFWWHLYISGISQLLLTQFLLNFKCKVNYNKTNSTISGFDLIVISLVTYISDWIHHLFFWWPDIIIKMDLSWLGMVCWVQHKFQKKQKVVSKHRGQRAEDKRRNITKKQQVKHYKKQTVNTCQFGTINPRHSHQLSQNKFFDSRSRLKRTGLSQRRKNKWKRRKEWWKKLSTNVIASRPLNREWLQRRPLMPIRYILVNTTLEHGTITHTV